jgi:hypothetical protein
MAFPQGKAHPESHCDTVTQSRAEPDCPRNFIRILGKGWHLRSLVILLEIFRVMDHLNEFLFWLIFNALHPLLLRG